MNPHYQYFLASGSYSNLSPAAPLVGLGDDIISPPPPSPTLTEAAVPLSPLVDTVVTEPTPTTPLTEIEPTVPSEPKLPPSTPLTEASVGATTIGDTEVKNPTTTINIFGQGTLTTSLADQISIDPDGNVITSTDDPNAAILPSGGGGGGGIGMPSGGKKSGKIAPKKKAWTPVLAMAVGVALIILKPVK